MKVQDVDLSKQPIQIQTFCQNVMSVLNSGLLEIPISFSQPPSTTAPQEVTMYLSIYGSTVRLYVSYLGNWYYTNLTKV